MSIMVGTGRGAELGVLYHDDDCGGFEVNADLTVHSERLREQTGQNCGDDAINVRGADPHSDHDEGAVAPRLASVI